jgi:Fe-S oxidoreductase
VTYFDYSDYGGMGGAVDMCSGLGACRKKLDGTMCPSYMATQEEADSTRGRANVLRLAMTGRIGEAGLGDQGVYQVLDLCLECRACKAECPVGVDMARFKSEFLADYWSRHGVSRHARILGNARTLAKWGSAFAPASNRVINSGLSKYFAERWLGIDRRRALPTFASRTLASQAPRADERSQAILFSDTFTNYYDPEIGVAVLEVLRTAGIRVGVVDHPCCGRPQISMGLLGEARMLAERNAEALHAHAAAGRKIVFCEPSCLSAIREDAPSLLRGSARDKAKMVASASVLFEEFAEPAVRNLRFKPGPPEILLHGHCHQKSMGLLGPAKALLAHVPGAKILDLDAGCCGMAGSFGYSAEHFDVSRAIGERKLLPAVRNKKPGTVVIASGTSCRHQVKDFTGERAVHPAVLLRSLLEDSE